MFLPYCAAIPAGGAASAQQVLTPGIALDIAMSNSPEIRRSRLGLEQSMELLNAARASLKSRFSLSLTPFYLRQDREFNDLFSLWFTRETRQISGRFMIEQPIKLTDGTLSFTNQFSWRDYRSGYQDQGSKTYNNNFFVSFTQPLLTYNRTKLEFRELELDLECSSLNYAVQVLVIEQRVMQSFFDAYQKKMSLDIAIEELRNQEEGCRIMKNKVEAGIEKMEELYQAEYNLSTSKSRVQNRRVELENTFDSFKQLLGLSLFEEIAVDADVSFREIDVDLPMAISHGIKHRMEIRRREIGIEEARNELIRTGARNEFRGDLNVSYGSIGTDEKFTDIYDEPVRNRELRISFEMPLWDWGEKRSRIRASEARIKSAELSKEEEHNNIIIEIRRAYRSLWNRISQIEIARQSVRNAELTYDINLERYRNGDLSSILLNDYQRQLSEARQGLIGELIGYKLDLLDLKVKSMWDFEGNRSVVPCMETDS